MDITLYDQEYLRSLEVIMGHLGSFDVIFVNYRYIKQKQKARGALDAKGR